MLRGLILCNFLVVIIIFAVLPFVLGLELEYDVEEKGDMQEYIIAKSSKFNELYTRI